MMWDNLGYPNGLGSGMDAPLMAIRELFGVAGKSDLVKYMPLVFTHHLFYPFSHPFSSVNPHLRSNSERDNYAREFLEANFEPPFQYLGL